jgi:hypothetical protein
MIINNDKALGEFIGIIGEAQEYLNELQEYFDNHMTYHPDEINYGHVGTAEYMVSKLKELADQVNNRGEYKPND